MNESPMEPEILYEDNHLLVVNKPPLIATMGAISGQPTLLEMAKSYLKRKYQKPGNVYLGVVSRLDAVTTGVIVFARTSKAAARLTKQFQNHQAKKTYWAIVEDTLPTAEQTLKHWVYKDDAKMHMVALDRPDDRRNAKEAILTYRVLGRHAGQALIAVELKTGRKHQIRVQLAKLKCPILGDKKYGSKIGFQPGIALHSQSLQLLHPTKKEEMVFQAPAPDCWFLDRFQIK